MWVAVGSAAVWRITTNYVETARRFRNDDESMSIRISSLDTTQLNIYFTEKLLSTSIIFTLQIGEPVEA